MILEALNAANGDATLLRHTGTSGRQIIGLIDGGPSATFEASIRPALEAHSISVSSGELDWVAVSHVDSDHIGGILKLARVKILVNNFLYNTPSAFPQGAVQPASTAASSPGGLEAQLSALVAAMQPELIPASIGNGQELLDLITGPGYGIHLLNAPDNRRLLTGDTCDLDGLTLTVVAPSQTRIDALLAEWAAEIAAGPVPASSTKLDTSVTNLSSLAFMAETAAGRTALFTGDGLEDDIVAGLEATGHTLPLHIDVLKVPHHGSNSAANASSISAGRGLIENVRADHYIVSANGQSTNPTLATLVRIISSSAGPSTIWLPSSRPQGPGTSAQYYRSVLDALDLLVSSAPNVEVRVGDGAPLIIDLS